MGLHRLKVRHRHHNQYESDLMLAQ